MAAMLKNEQDPCVATTTKKSQIGYLPRCTLRTENLSVCWSPNCTIIIKVHGCIGGRKKEMPMSMSEKVHIRDTCMLDQKMEG